MQRAVWPQMINLMFMGNHQTILVLGLGNPVLSDDGVGLAVAERLESLLEEHAIPGNTNT